MKAVKIQQKSIFDTRFDTKKIFVTTKNRFSLRTHLNKDGNSLIYLDVRDKSKRERINTEIYIPPKCWNPKSQRIKNHPEADKLNLVLKNIEARITTIKTNYMLQDRPLGAKQLIKEFQTATPEFDFIAFYRHHLSLQDFKPQTRKNHETVLNKLEKFRKEIPFHAVTMELLQQYRKFYPENSLSTYHTDLKCIKKYLRIAQKSGIKLNLDLDDIKINVQNNNPVYLLPGEMKVLVEYYFHKFINPSHLLPLGYFLFSCYTGLRISDIKVRTRGEILSDRFQFSAVKTDQPQFMRLNEEGRKIVLHNPELFEKKLVEQKINFHLKAIAKQCKIDKPISMHTGRHTFATTFIRNKGDIYRLQKLLGHANIRHTLGYVHIVQSEVLDDLDLISY